MRRSLLLLPLLALLACKPGPVAQVDDRPYAQAVEGLTLVYIDPELQEPERSAQRLQVRVDHVAHQQDGSLIVEKQYIRGIDPPFYSSLLLKDGGVSVVDPRGKVVADLLPKGFPDATATWALPASAPPERRTQFTIIGRATWTEGAAVLPPGSNLMGVWVEARPPHGLRTRILYLRGLGEVETLEERPGGAWVCVNRLQQRGFVDEPPTSIH